MLTLLLIMMVAAISLSIAGAVLAQTRPTQVEQKNTLTVAAAEAGLDATLDRLRAAASTSGGTGVLTSLPCTAGTGTVISGSVGSVTGAAGCRSSTRPRTR